MHNEGCCHKNAIEHVHDVHCKLQNAQDCLNKAISSVEKPANKQRIEATLNAVNNALNSCNETINNYQES